MSIVELIPLKQNYVCNVLPLISLLVIIFIIDSQLIHSVIKAWLVAPKEGVSVQQTSVIRIQIQVEDKTSENEKEDTVVDPDVSLVEIVDCLLVSSLSIEECQCWSQL